MNAVIAFMRHRTASHRRFTIASSTQTIAAVVSTVDATETGSTRLWDAVIVLGEGE